MTDLYVHFPFCKKKCLFCHYVAMYNASDEEKDRYIDAIDKEIYIYKQTVGLDKIKLRVGLIGGGTPTELSASQLERFLKILYKHFDMSKTEQITYDVTPNSIIGKEGLEKLKILKEYGVNRLTIGSQTMDEKILSQMNRCHTKAEAFEAVATANSLGFNTQVEFIYGFPGQTIDSWYNELEEIALTEAEEIQFYRLKVDAYGDTQGLIKNYINEHSTPSLEDTLFMRKMIFDYLTDFGWSERMRRIFTKNKNKYSKYLYNQYINMFDTVGIGVGAFSSFRDRFVLNTPDFNQYYKCIDEGALPVNRGLIRNKSEQMQWAAILPLKNDYLRKDYYRIVAGIAIEETPLYPVIQKLKKHNLVDETENSIKLTKTGILFADEVVETLYSIKYLPFEQKQYKNSELNPYFVADKCY